MLGGLLALVAAATEGIGLALLAPLVALLSENSGSAGWIGRTVRRSLDAVGLPLSFPVLLTVFVALIVLRAVALGLRNISLARLGLEFSETWRRKVYRAIATASWSFLMRQRLSNLQEALTSQIDRIGHGAYFFLRLPAILVVAASQIAIVLSLSPVLTIGVLCWGAALLGIIQWRFGSRYSDGLVLATAHRAAFDEVSDFLHALKLAKSHDAQSQHVAAFDIALERRIQQTMSFERRSTQASALIQIGAGISLGVFAYVGAEMVRVDLAVLLVMVVVFSRLAPLAVELQSDWVTFAQMLPVFDMVADLQARCVAAAELAPSCAERLELAREIRFENVSFRYAQTGSAPIIQNLNATIDAHSVVAIIGRTGAGKSTLADLLLGLITPDSGKILIDGVSLDDRLLARWRRSIGYVPQDNFLFNDTVRANLSWANPRARAADFQRVLSAAAAAEFVAALPQGLETRIGERGIRLSGGERQRLGLARALLREPTFLLLDEATSALDSQTEWAVQSAIEKLRGSMTIVVIAHRLATVRNADLILVLEGGRLVQSGTWETLAQDREGIFATLVEDGLRALQRAEASE
jgi:ATP-binding cassette subfamily C protein